MSDFDGIPTRRTSARNHLQRAAKAPLGSKEEHYCLLAAIAESLLKIEEHLAKRGQP